MVAVSVRSIGEGMKKWHGRTAPKGRPIIAQGETP